MKQYSSIHLIVHVFLSIRIYRYLHIVYILCTIYIYTLEISHKQPQIRR